MPNLRLDSAKVKPLCKEREKTKQVFHDIRRLNFQGELTQLDDRIHPALADFSKNHRSISWLKQELARGAGNPETTQDDNHKRRLSDRLGKGYYWPGGVVGGTAKRPAIHHDAFRETGLRSEAHPLLELFLTKLPAKNIGSYHKDIVAPVASKLLARDLPYIVMNPELVGVIRVDLDRKFDSWPAVHWYLEDECGLPPAAFPHIATAIRADGDEYIDKPHLIWVLPQDGGVYTGPGAKEGPRKLLDMVSRGLVASVHGDPGGMLNPLRVKNPLSPHMSTVILNHRSPLTLSDLAALIPEEKLKTTRGDIWSAAVVSAGSEDGLDEEQSNAEFQAFSRLARTTLREWYADSDGRMNLSDREELARELYAALEPHGREAGAERILKSVCRWSAIHFDPERIGSTRPNQGILASQLARVEGVRARQAEGGRYVAATRKEQTLQAIRDAIEAEGGLEKATKRAVARRSGRSLDTVKRRWNEATWQERSIIEMDRDWIPFE